MQTFQADWARNGRAAAILRDDRMAKECTHALVFLGQKSTRLEKFAEKICKKDKVVFTSSHNQTLTQFEMSQSAPPSQKQASKHAHKSSKGIEQMWQKYQNERRMLKITPTNIPTLILVVAKIHTPPSKLRAAHTAKIMKRNIEIIANYSAWDLIGPLRGVHFSINAV